MTSLTLDRYKGHAFSYDVIDVGYNYRMGELNASLGLAQLAMLKARNEQRKEWVECYSAQALVRGRFDSSIPECA